jgi:hypothetical protein
VQSRTAKALIALAALVAVVVLFVVLAGGDDDGSSDGSTTESTATQTATKTQTTTTQTTTVPAPEEIVVRDGKPVGGVKDLSFDNGDQIRFVVRSDVADEVHIHGYDKSEDVPANGSVRFSFPASIEGVFEVELEGRGVQIAELRVSP